MKQMRYIVVLQSEVLRGERVAVRLLPLRCVYTGGKRVMFIKSVHYILTFHIPQRMGEAWGGRPHYIFISLFFVFLFGALLGFNI